MSGLFGQGQKNGFELVGGGTGAPWNWGVSPFDQSQISEATGANVGNIENRYQELGLGGSSMEQQDVAGAEQMGEAMTGQLQTQNEANPALNPALQPQLNTVISGGGNNQTLSSLASAAGLATGAGNLGTALGTGAAVL